MVGCPAVLEEWVAVLAVATEAALEVESEGFLAEAQASRKQSLRFCSSTVSAWATTQSWLQGSGRRVSNQTTRMRKAPTEARVAMGATAASSGSKW